MNKRGNDSQETQSQNKQTKIHETDNQVDKISAEMLTMNVAKDERSYIITPNDSPAKRPGGKQEHKSKKRINLPSKPKSTKQENTPRQQSIRALITAKEAGQIIGKAGSQISAIRKESYARVIVSDNENTLDRVVTVTGLIDQIAKAFALIVTAILKDTADSTANVSFALGNQKTLFIIIGLLVSSTKMGCVIGKGGSKMKFIQDQSGVTIHASQVPLPGSTERVVTLTGVIDAIHIAVYHLGVALQSAVDEGKIQTMFTPGMHQPYTEVDYPPPPQNQYQSYPQLENPYSRPIQPPPDLPMSSSLQYTLNSTNSYSPSFDPRNTQVYAIQDHKLNYAPSNIPYNQGMAQNYPHKLLSGLITDYIQIPSKSVGILIGKGGDTIKHIRQVSGSQIAIKPQGVDLNIRDVEIVGSFSGNQAALLMVRDIVFK